jgi:formamidopyrimidine-DNA glycosylase
MKALPPISKARGHLGIMPELPDVETFRAMVRRHFGGDPVSGVVVSDPKSFEGATVAAVQRRLKGRALSGTGRHGKYLFLDFNEHCVIVMHFGPAGSLARVTVDQEQPAYVRFRFDFSNGESLAYVNRRRIGRVRLVDSVANFLKQARLGPDALDPGFEFPDFAKRLAGRKQPIKGLLTDQKKISGIGNTWSDEILFQARIHPAIPAGALTPVQSRRLFRTMRSVLRTAIDLDPATNDFRSRLPARFLLPHRHTGGHCPRCDTELARTRAGGHTSTYCPHCQLQ